MIGAKRKAESGLGTDGIVQQALREKEAEKEAKRRLKDPGAVKKMPKGKTLGEIEADEGGAVKESLVGMAQTKRAAQRKQAHIDDTELVGDADIEAVEERLEAAEDDGVALEPFNLEQERREGFFDEEGHYVEKKDEEEKDAWLASSEAEVVSERVRRQIAERQAAMAAAEAAPEMSGRAAAELKRLLAAELRPGETVTAALRRLRPATTRPAGKRGKQPSAAVPAAAPIDAAAAAAFERVTEAASALMDSGELDVYSLRREDFERAATLFAPVDPEPSGRAGSGPADDMFADSDDEAGAPGPSARPNPAGPGPAAAPSDAGGAPAGGTVPSNSVAGSGVEPDTAAALDAAASAGAQNGGGGAQRASASAVEAGEGIAGADGTPPTPNAPAPNGQAAAAPAQEADDYALWPVKELRRFLSERGVDLGGIVDKSELVAKVREAAAAGPEGEAAAPPPGYAYDPASGLYADGSGMFYDARSGGFYSSASGLWYGVDASGQYVPWSGQGGADGSVAPA